MKNGKMKIKYTSRLVIFFASLLFTFILLFISSTFSFLVTFFGHLIVLGCVSWNLMVFIKWQIVEKYFLPKVDPKDKSILVTGCDSGFGYAIALSLNKAGFKVYAGCLSPDGDGARRLLAEATNPSRIEILDFDVTNDEHIDRVYNTINNFIKKSRRSEKLWGVVNNAGIGRSSYVEMGSFEFHFEKVFNVNTFSVIKITRKFLPLIRESKGRIACISSVAGRLTTAQLSAYSMTKHSIVAFCDSLREELDRHCVKVSCIEPYFYRTNIIEQQAVQEWNDKIWNETSDEIRKTYNVVKGAKNIDLEQLVENPIFGANHKIHQVTDCVLSSMMDHEPQVRYCPSPILVKPISLILQLLPKDVTQMINIKSTVKRFFQNKKKN